MCVEGRGGGNGMMMKGETPESTNTQYMRARVSASVWQLKVCFWPLQGGRNAKGVSKRLPARIRAGDALGGSGAIAPRHKAPFRGGVAGLPLLSSLAVPRRQVHHQYLQAREYLLQPPHFRVQARCCMHASHVWLSVVLLWHVL